MRSPFSKAALLLLAATALAACGGGDVHNETAPVGAELTAMERGAILYKRCRACHTLGEGERHKVGPNLWQVMGQTAGAREDFNYSRAMAESDIVWTDETLSAYLERPSAYIPGNRMSYAGLRKPEDRAALIEYLRAETGADAP
ncbi:MAG: cytochrome c family protein [Litorimonas sp.]